jgi:hypothetical protein
MPEQRTKYIRKARERQLELALHARCFHDGRLARTHPRVLEQRRLADAGFTEDGERAAAAGRSLIEKQIDSRSLFTPPYEHLPKR